MLATEYVLCLIVVPVPQTDYFQQLWDVIGDQAAIELVRDIEDAQQASSILCQHALSHHTTDNVTVVVVRFKHLGPHAV